MKQIAEGLFLRSLGMVNTYLLDLPEGVVLIDAGFPGSEGKILAAIAELGHPPRRLAHIVLTHAHPDHVGSLAALVRASGAQTWMHELDAPLVEGGAMRPVHPAPGLLPKLMFGLLSLMPRRVEAARIDHRITDGTALPFGGLQAIHAPGHCAGQVALLCPARDMLFAADTCMNLVRLRTPLVNEDLDLARRTLKRLSALEFGAACLGHGPPILGGASARFRQAFG